MSLAQSSQAPHLFKPGNKMSQHIRRPKDVMTRILIAQLDAESDRPLGSKLTDRQYRKMEAVCDRLIQEAINGDMEAIKYIFDRIDGKPTERIGDPDGNPLAPGAGGRPQVLVLFGGQNPKLSPEDEARVVDVVPEPEPEESAPSAEKAEDDKS